MTTRESKIERDANKFAESLGFVVYKVTFYSVNGAPDRLYTHRLCRAFFIEYKAKDKEPTEQQYKRHRELRDAGFTVYWVDNLEAAKNCIRVELDRAICGS